ncbi:MAG: polysulfide reductase NrfD [Xanthomonadales bacterium]|nr:polysulfide reductase NrfD [Xanthomonadales bacterium]
MNATSPRAPVIHGDPGIGGLTARLSDLVLERPPGRGWLIAMVVALALAGLLAASIAWLLYRGVGIWGIDMPVVWAFAIANYVWWIAIGMGGTFISAALLLARQPWRNALNRYAEAMTVFAVAVSSLFPILHLGRPWFFYWLAPYPNRMALWPQWRSSLLWDFFAILAYLIASILYFYIGLIPDLATLRDRSRTRGKQVFFGLLALGWSGEARDWRRHETLSLLLAGLAVPLVFSVHSMVALDFSEALLPGWHSTIFPPFFVAGALFSGFAMVLVLAIPLRRLFGLTDLITARHLDNLGRMVLAAGLFVGYSYAVEIFTAFYGGDRYEIALAMNRLTGHFAWTFWIAIACNVVAIQALWFRAVRANPAALFAIGLTVLVGMWFERFMLIVTTLYRDFLPSSWGTFRPTFWDYATLAGSIGLFALLFLVFVRVLPVLPMFEMRKLVQHREARP